MLLKEIDNAAEYVRQNPKMFFRTGAANGTECAIQLLGDALIEGACNVSVLRNEHWWIVGAEQDWLVHTEFSARELFDRLVAFPKAGDNSFRSEILIGAFAQEIAIFIDGSGTLLRGNAIPAAICEIVTKRSEWRRAIAFQWIG